MIGTGAERVVLIQNMSFETGCLHPFFGARARALLFVTTHETEFANMLSAARNRYSTDKGSPPVGDGVAPRPTYASCLDHNKVGCMSRLV